MCSGVENALGRSAEVDALNVKGLQLALRQGRVRRNDANMEWPALLFLGKQSARCNQQSAE